MNVSSRVENLSLINQKLEQLREEFKISKITYEKMLSSVNEAFMNAVDHGNKGEISKIVTFEPRILAEGKIVLTISGEGNGLKWKHTGRSSAERRFGKECDSTCGSRWSRCH